MAKLKILWLTTSTNNTATFFGSLDQLGEHEIVPFPYDQKFYQQINMAVQQNPSLKNAQGQVSLQALFQNGFSRERFTSDNEILMEAKINKPDVVVYVSAWTGHFIPLNETMCELNTLAPVIHFLCDGQDPPWREQLYEFDRRGQFALTVNIDGGHRWPGGSDWADDATRLKGKCLTLLTPIDLRAYRPTGLSFGERPYPIAYGGSPSSSLRGAIIERLQRVQGFKFRGRDDNPASYPDHIAFLQHSMVSVNVPFTGSGVERHVKGRILEAGFAGACNLEWASDTMRSWFIPRYEYVEYDSVESCAEMAEWYSHHPKLAEEIGMAMKARLEKEHAPKVFWDRVLSEVAK